MRPKLASLLNYRAAFVGTARNCAPFLPAALANISHFAAHYGAAAYVFVVGDSTDQTLMMLREWLSDGRTGCIIDQGNLATIEPRRTMRIAAARNSCMDEIRGACQDFDHVVVCDLDEVLSEPVNDVHFAAAAAWLAAHPSRAGVSANATPRYFDIWALRHARWCPHDCWHAIWGRPPREPFDVAKYRHVFSRQVRIPHDAAPIEVDSAFGGLAIYKLKFAASARYVGMDALGREQAEHVAFHESITCRGGRLFIFPSLVVQAPTEHLFRFAGASWRLRLTMLSHNLSELWRPRLANLQNDPLV